MLIFQSVKNHDDHQLNIAENSMISANTKYSSVKYHHDENTLISDQKIRAIEQLFRTLASLAIPWPTLIIHFFFFKEFKGPNYGCAELRENE